VDFKRFNTFFFFREIRPHSSGRITFLLITSHFSSSLPREARCVICFQNSARLRHTYKSRISQRRCRCDDNSFRHNCLRSSIYRGAYVTDTTSAWRCNYRSSWLPRRGGKYEDIKWTLPPQKSDKGYGSDRCPSSSRCLHKYGCILNL
jgi:hypothetical protein